jgi:hypothetical protein
MAAEMMDGISDQPITTDAQAEAAIAANANKIASRSDALGANTNKRKAIDADTIESDMEALERQAEKIRVAKIAKTSAYNAEEINLDDDTDDIDMITTTTGTSTTAAVVTQSNPEEINLDDIDSMDQDDDSYLSQAQSSSSKEKDIQLIKKQIPDAVFGDAKAAFAAQQAKAKAAKK